MQFTDKMVEVESELRKLRHTGFIIDLHKPMIGKSEKEIEKIKREQFKDSDPIRLFWKQMQGADAVLVLNFDKNEIKNYVGGNTLIEIGFAHVLKQKIFMWNPVPDMAYCKYEIESVNPVIINGDLTKIK